MLNIIKKTYKKKNNVKHKCAIMSKKDENIGTPSKG